ncbi:LOW QUALITY PROTEIN: NACHT, LRR and PYD domains-containing protein 3 [Epinephelus fuscoguttatus]|uniref:LOW QUALITY PROTEIN: NACHT, LRR and PYD domains-containing protein 3 n=1 Tax=Epinephelus fuscoguttatus TaxID=293821 RepID=UPI0020D11DF6|nr:LOW QUALITY PROTEIN: NACHT, LRR and PYD domains-containing protein 3 [Epinephelus fuscoguttatus]
MDKGSVLTHILKSNDMSTLLGGELPVSVISNNKYISPLTAEAQAADRNGEEDPPSLDCAIHTALSGEIKSVILVGPEGSGKTTALVKLVMGWAKGEHLQKFSYVFHFRFRELNSLDGALSLETLLLHHQSHAPPESVPLLLQKPEDVLFVFDDLDRYKHSLDPSVHTLCSDPTRAASVPCLVASLLHGSLMKGAAFVVATRPTSGLEFLSGTRVKVLGFLKPQREAYFSGFFTDPAVAKKALMHMERTLGFYDVCASPKFCWTVCSVYKSLMDAGAKLPETLSQLCVDILVHLIQTLSLNNASSRDLVLALGKLASHCFLNQHSSCTKEEMDSFGFQQFLTSVGVFLHVEGDQSDVFSFRSQLMQEFLLAASFFLDKSPSEGVEKMLEKHKGCVKFLDFFMSGLSEPLQRRPLENVLGELNSDRIVDFKSWFKSSSEKTLKECYKERHHRCFHLLHQAQSESLVKEIITPSDHLASALSRGLTKELDLSNSRLGDEKFKILCAGLRDCKLHTLKLLVCRLTEGICEHLASVLTSATSQLSVLDMRCNQIGDQGFTTMCKALHSPHCKLQELMLQNCELTAASMEALSAAVCSGQSQLRKVDLTHNVIGDRGVETLCKSLQHPLCKLQSLNFFDSELTGACCPHLMEALMSEHCSLTELDLSVNDLGQEGALLLCQALSRPGCPMEKLGLKRCELTEAVFKELSSVLRSGMSQLKSLIVGINAVGDQGVKHLWDAVAHPNCLLEELDVEMTGLTDACVEDMCAAIRASKTLKSLELRNNTLTDVSVPALVEVMQDSPNMKEMNLKYNEFSEEVFDMLDECDTIRY